MQAESQIRTVQDKVDSGMRRETEVTVLQHIVRLIPDRLTRLIPDRLARLIPDRLTRLIPDRLARSSLIVSPDSFLILSPDSFRASWLTVSQRPNRYRLQSAGKLLFKTCSKV